MPSPVNADALDFAVGKVQSPAEISLASLRVSAISKTRAHAEEEETRGRVLYLECSRNYF